MSATPLAGLKVIELSHTVMGPTTGLVFAELGADVIKVEPAPHGDHTRALGGFSAGFFATFNRNKRSLALDLKQPKGQAMLHRLVSGSDVVIENYAPGTMERLGCGYETLAKINPSLVYLALKGYLAGPYEHRPALDEVVQFHVGLAYMTGPPGQPLRAGASIIDILGAVFGVVAAQAALREREITGKGQRVSSALFESAAFLMGTHMGGLAATGLPAMPMPARRGAWAIYEVFATADGGQLFIGVTSDQQWVRFTEAFGLRDLATDPRLRTNAMRGQQRSWLIPTLKEIFGKLPQQEVMRLCEGANISWAPVGQPADLFSDAHLLASGGLLDVLVPRLGASEGQKVGLLSLAFSRYLKRPDMVDRCGGTDIVPMSPSGVRITDGLQNVICMSLSDKGRLRWHTACCQTPLGNTPRSGKISYVGLIMTCFDAAPDIIETTLGPRDRIVLNTASATCKVRSTPLPFLLGGLNILRHIVVARFGAPQPSPFFDSKGPLRSPIALNAVQREALGANPA